MARPALAAVTAAWAVERLLGDVLGTRSLLAAGAFALALMVPVAIGQLPFLCGEAAGLVALVSLRRHHRLLALIFAACCPLFSPVSGVFLLIAIAAIAIAECGATRWFAVQVGAMVALPLVIAMVAFPDPGTFPFPVGDLITTLGVVAALWWIAPHEWRAFRVGIFLYGLLAIADFTMPNALGGNYQRLALAMSPALALAFATLPRRRWVVLLALPLLVWQWSPALPAISATVSAPSSQASYYQPLVAYLEAQPTVGRVEIPFTQAHWETAYVAPKIPLARGWERQLDVADNPIFYAATPLTATSYERWLVDQGVSWVALPDAPLDYSSRAEGTLLRTGTISDLHEVWHNAHWTVWQVRNSPGIVSPPTAPRLTRNLEVRDRRADCRANHHSDPLHQRMEHHLRRRMRRRYQRWLDRTDREQAGTHRGQRHALERIHLPVTVTRTRVRSLDPTAQPRGDYSERVAAHPAHHVEHRTRAPNVRREATAATRNEALLAQRTWRARVAPICASSTVAEQARSSLGNMR